jgi:hypothetical protein
MSQRTLNKTCLHCRSRITVHYRQQEITLGWGTEWIWPDVKTFLCPNCHCPLYHEPMPPVPPHPVKQVPISCPDCHSPTNVVQLIEGGGDTIARRVCITCRRELYTASCTLRPSVHVSTKSSKGKFFCKKCGFSTDCSQCPCCGTQLA